MNKHSWGIYLLLTLLWVCYGCENTLDGLTLRSDQNERFYWENNAAASARIAKIMYNESNGSQTIDDPQDLYNNAETLFAEGIEALFLYGKRYGGYWRFPKSPRTRCDSPSLMQKPAP